MSMQLGTPEIEYLADALESLLSDQSVENYATPAQIAAWTGLLHKANKALTGEEN